MQEDKHAKLMSMALVAVRNGLVHSMKTVFAIKMETSKQMCVLALFAPSSPPFSRENDWVLETEYVFMCATGGRWITNI